MKQYPVPAVGVFIFYNSGLYLIKKGRSIFKGQWCTPGGKIEYGENILDTVHREVREETGLEIDNVKFITYEQTIEKDKNGGVYRHFVFFNFQANIKSGIPSAADDAAEICWFPLDKLKGLDLSDPTIRTLRLLGII